VVKDRPLARSRRGLPHRRSRVLAGVYVAGVVGLTVLGLIEPYSYAYYVRFLLLLPTSLLAFYLDWAVGIILFGPDPSGFTASAYFVGVAFAAALAQLMIFRSVRSAIWPGT
jgi:hypothetical protein